MDLESRLSDIERRYDRLSAETASPDVAADRDRLRRLGKDLAELGEIVGPYREYKDARRQAEEAGAMAAGEKDPEMAAYLRQEAHAAGERAASLQARLEQLLVPKDPNDARDVIVEIRAGAGGEEAALWAGELFEMYRHFAERHGWKTEILSASPSDLGGFKEVVLEVKGKGAYSRLKHESGVHRVQRVPVTESGGRIHTSTATVAVLPVAEEVDLQIRPEDLKIDVYRSSGPGGQSVNTTDSAVRITHLPTGIVVAMQDERSQLQNRDKAMRVLRARVYEAERERQAAEQAAARSAQVGTGARAEKIRTYNFPENRVTDHRIKLTTHRLDQVLQGDLDEYTDALTSEQQRRALEG